MPNDPRVNPAGEFADIRALIRRVAELEDHLRLIRERTYGLRAQITAYTGGSATMTVTVPAVPGSSMTARFMQGYTPVVGHFGLVICTPEANWWVGRDSVP